MVDIKKHYCGADLLFNTKQTKKNNIKLLKKELMRPLKLIKGNSFKPYTLKILSVQSFFIENRFKTKEKPTITPWFIKTYTKL